MRASGPGPPTSPRRAAIKGRLTSTPDSDFTVELFANAADEDEDRTFIARNSVPTDGDGIATFTVKPEQKVGKGKVITATTTDEASNTSEFSDPETVA